MIGNFKVGEVLVGQKYTVNQEFNGMECVVIEGMMTRTMYRINREIETWDGPCYMVIWANGMTTGAEPHNLRRKQPPAGEQSVLDMFKLPAPSKEIA